MKVLHDWKCKSCKLIFEKLVNPKSVWQHCPQCNGYSTKYWGQWRKGVALQVFPEGDWHGLPEVDGHPPEIRTRRQLREALKRKAKDEFTESYSAYDDGYSGVK